MRFKSQFFVLRQIRARPRLTVAVLIGIAVAMCIPQSWMIHKATQLILSWNATTCLYLMLGGVMMIRSNEEQIQKRALLEDDGKFLILAFVVLAAIAGLSAVVVELAAIKDMKGSLKHVHIALAALTIVSSWAFTHMMFALHYAHDFYVALAKSLPGGLDFPGEATPDYGDFLYFAFVIGTSGQTADVSITSKSLRRIVLAHCIFAFAFNTTVLALTINIAASLI